MSEKRYSLSTIQDHYVGKDVYHLPETPDSEYVVDDSCFVPMSEAVKQLGLNPNFTGSDQKTMYDFPDGNDTGVEIPINRTKNGKDIAELSSSIAEQNEKISSALEAEQKQAEFEQQYNQKIAEQKAASQKSE